MRRPLFLLPFFAVAPAAASAHSLVLYASTPASPPREFYWWLPFSTAILVGGAFLLLRRRNGFERGAALARAAVAVGVFAAAYVLFWTFFGYGGAPRPSETFWGMGWSMESVLFFAIANLTGWLFFFGALHFIGGDRRSIRLALPALGVYALTLTPYLLSGALVHGWAGAYANGACRVNLLSANESLAAWALEHDGRLPEADDAEALAAELVPYPPERFGGRRFLPVCPVGKKRDRNPKPYAWDTSFSGADLRMMDPARLETPAAPISCPYHPDFGRQAARPLREALESLQGAPSSVKEAAQEERQP